MYFDAVFIMDAIFKSIVRLNNDPSHLLKCQHNVKINHVGRYFTLLSFRYIYVLIFAILPCNLDGENPFLVSM